MTLADKFPKKLVADSVERQFRPGTVIKLEATMDDGKSHLKRYVIVAVTESAFVLVINSEISDYIKARPILLQSQVPMPAAAHSFMDHDSHIDCSRARVFMRQAAIEQLQQNPAWVLGTITQDTGNAIVASIKPARTISTKQKEQLCESLARCDFA